MKMRNAKGMTHKGWMFGIVPVYLNFNHDSGLPEVMERHWTLLPLLCIAESVWGMCTWLRCLADRDFEPFYRIHVTGEL